MRRFLLVLVVVRVGVYATIWTGSTADREVQFIHAPVSGFDNAIDSFHPDSAMTYEDLCAVKREYFRAIRRGDRQEAIEILDANPELVPVLQEIIQDLQQQRSE